MRFYGGERRSRVNTDENQQQEAAKQDETELEALREEGEAEAGVGTAMRVFEQAEQHYFGAVASTTTRKPFVTRADTTAAS
jgi:hypothetical protein